MPPEIFVSIFVPMFFGRITIMLPPLKKPLCLLALLWLCAGSTFSQRGLENIIVETYYVSDAADTLQSRVGGYLEPGSVTYRIYADLAPEYRLYNVFGNQRHELRLESTQRFFNNEDAGQRMPNVVPRRSLVRNTVMLDSWLSMGGAAENCYGVLKDDDDTLETIQHEHGFLQAKNKKAGIPLSRRDGLRFAEQVAFPLLYGPDSLFYVFFNSTNSSRMITSNGAWSCPGGAVGPDSLGTNRILIAQLTTAGDLSFELNLQVGKRFHPPEMYIARNPVGDEIQLPCLVRRVPAVRAKRNTKSVGSTAVQPQAQIHPTHKTQ